MKNTFKARNVVLTLIGAAMLAGLSSLAAEQKTKPPAKKAAATSPADQGKIWVSQSSHHEFRVKIDGDLFSAEWVNIPPTSAKLGAYIRTECRRVGNRWIGTNRVLLACAKPGESKVTHTCPMTFRFEVDEITPERISGRGESLRNFDCETCQIRETGWARYVWVPKK